MDDIHITLMDSILAHVGSNELSILTNTSLNVCSYITIEKLSLKPESFNSRDEKSQPLSKSSVNKKTHFLCKRSLIVPKMFNVFSGFKTLVWGQTKLNSNPAVAM